MGHENRRFSCVHTIHAGPPRFTCYARVKWGGRNSSPTIGASITSQTKAETFGPQEIHRETTDEAWHKIAAKAFLLHLLGRHEHTYHGDPEGEEGDSLKPLSPDSSSASAGSPCGG